MLVTIDWVRRTFWLREDPDPVPPRLGWDLFSDIRIRGFSPMALTLTTTQFFIVALNPVDANGNHAPLDGIPKWESNGPVDLAIADDGLSARVTPTGPVGHAQISVTADVRLGPDLRLLTGVLEIDVIPAEAVSLGLSAGEPQEREPAPVEPTEPTEPPVPVDEPAPIEEPASVDEAIPTEPTEPPPAE